MKKASSIILLIILSKLSFSQNKVDTLMHNLQKGVAIYNCVMDPELLQAMQSFTDSTNINIYTVPKIQDDGLIAEWVNEISELKDEAKPAPYLKFIVWFIPVKQPGQYTTYTVQVEIEPSPDIQIAADALQQVIDNINQVLSGQFDPENAIGMKNAIKDALDDLKGMLGNVVNGFEDLLAIISELVSEISLANNQVLDNANDSIPILSDEKTEKESSYYEEKENLVIGEFESNVAFEAHSISMPESTEELSDADEAILRQNSNRASFMNVVELLIWLEKNKEIAENIYNIITQLSQPGELNQLASDIIQELQDAGIDYIEKIENGQSVDLKNDIKPILVDILIDKYVELSNNN